MGGGWVEGARWLAAELLAPHQPTGEVMSIYDAALKYRDEGVPLIVVAGKEYGTGSSRDWRQKDRRYWGSGHGR